MFVTNATLGRRCCSCRQNTRTITLALCHSTCKSPSDSTLQWGGTIFAQCLAPSLVSSLKSDTFNHLPRTAVHRNTAVHFRTRPRSYLAPIKMSWWYLERFKSYGVDKQTDTQTPQIDTTENNTELRFAIRYCCAGGNQWLTSYCMFDLYEYFSSLFTIIHSSKHIRTSLAQ